MVSAAARTLGRVDGSRLRARGALSRGERAGTRERSRVCRLGATRGRRGGGGGLRLGRATPAEAGASDPIPSVAGSGSPPSLRPGAFARVPCRGTLDPEGIVCERKQFVGSGAAAALASAPGPPLACGSRLFGIEFRTDVGRDCFVTVRRSPMRLQAGSWCWACTAAAAGSSRSDCEGWRPLRGEVVLVGQSAESVTAADPIELDHFASSSGVRGRPPFTSGDR